MSILSADIESGAVYACRKDQRKPVNGVGVWPTASGRADRVGRTIAAGSWVDGSAVRPGRRQSAPPSTGRIAPVESDPWRHTPPAGPASSVGAAPRRQHPADGRGSKVLRVL